MLENITKRFSDVIDGENISLAIDAAMEESLRKAPHTEVIGEDHFGVTGGGTLSIKEFCINACALPSILEAYKMGGRAFYSEGTTDEKLCGVFETMRHMVKEDCQVIIADDQVIGLRSSRYKLVPLHDILDEILPVITNWYKEYVKSEVEMSYSETYIKFFTDKELTFNGKTKPLTVTLKNSENGESSIWINAYLGRSCLIPIMRGMNITHTKNKATIEELRDRISGLENVVEQAFERIAELEKYQLSRPADAVDALQQKYKFGQVYCNAVKDQICANPGFNYTAGNIYEMFADAMLSGSGCSRETLEGYQNDMLKMLDSSFDWSKFC